MTREGRPKRHWMYRTTKSKMETSIICKFRKKVTRITTIRKYCQHLFAHYAACVKRPKWSKSWCQKPSPEFGPKNRTRNPCTHCARRACAAHVLDRKCGPPFGHRFWPRTGLLFAWAQSIFVPKAWPNIRAQKMGLLPGNRAVCPFSGPENWPKKSAQIMGRQQRRNSGRQTWVGKNEHNCEVNSWPQRFLHEQCVQWFFVLVLCQKIGPEPGPQN